MRGILLRAGRLGLLVLAVLCVRDAHHRRQSRAAAAPLSAAQVHDFFPTAAEVAPLGAGSGWNVVKDASGIVLGSVAVTAPESDRLIGYSGPTNTLIARDATGRMTGVRVLSSDDTPDHLAEVVADRAFFAQFRDKPTDEILAATPHTVSGATLTSSAIAEGILTRLGRTAGTSLRFPDEITLDEVRALEPRAASLQARQGSAGTWNVLDEQQHIIAQVLRTSPVTDALTGYKGPTDTLLLLDAEGMTLRRIAIRRSYDTKRYVAYVTGDSYFLHLFDNRRLSDLAQIDFTAEKIEGVSGATETSWAVAEGIKRRAAALLEKPAEAKAWWQAIRWRWQDTGHVLIILAALLMAFGPWRGHRWLRHGHHAVLIIYAGFIAGELLSQALLTGWAAHGTPWRQAPGLVLLAIAALTAPVLTRRQLYCHHICPHGALQQLIAKRLPWQWSPGPIAGRVLGAMPWLLLFTAIATAMLALPIDLNSTEPFDAYVPRIAGWAALGIAIAGIIFSLFVPMGFCRYGCPTGALFKLVRHAGQSDRLHWRDAIAAALIIGLWGISHAW